MISIDQNCHSLWDAVPKLHAIAAAGGHVRHFVEDIDVAFTALGAKDGPLHIARERYYRSGGSDWGAALFYSEFLSALPVEIRQWEPYTGLSTKALAKGLDVSVDDLYERFSPSGTWQLIGPSYAGPGQHRVIGDLSMAETAQFVRELMMIARADMLERFPQPSSRARVNQWFDAEQAFVDDAIARLGGGRLVELYRTWMRRHVGEAMPVGLTSELFSLRGSPEGVRLLELFTRHHEWASELYNQAVRQANVGVHELGIAAGELPFYATYQSQGRLVRSGGRLEGGEITFGPLRARLGDGGSLPLDELERAGVCCLAGKAILLVTQARLGEGGQSLALPYKGSMYMPAARLLERKLRDDGLLTAPAAPVVRVRLRMLDRMVEVDTAIRLPAHLRALFGRDELPAAELARQWPGVVSQSQAELAELSAADGRERWQRRHFGKEFEQMDELEAQRSVMLASPEPPVEPVRRIWKDIRELRTAVLRLTVERLAALWQGRELDYWDSRGAVLPWCVALGGEDFYGRVIRGAEIYEEHNA